MQNHAKAHKVAPAIRYIEISEIVKYAGMSSSSLHEQFKKATSLSPIQFIKKLRLHHAHNLILEGITPGEAAMDAGYNSQSQFSREFKRDFGYSPGEARKNRWFLVN